MTSSIEKNDFDLYGAFQIFSDTLGKSKELEGCKLVDKTLGLEPEEGCFSSLVENYTEVQELMIKASERIGFALNFYANFGKGNGEGSRIVDGITNQQDDIYHNTEYKIIREDLQEEGQDILERLRKLQARKLKKEKTDKKTTSASDFSSLESGSSGYRTLGSGSNSSKSSQSSGSNEPKIGPEVDQFQAFQEKIDKLSDDFGKKCIRNSVLQQKNPQCFKFLNSRLAGIKIDPQGVQAIEYYRLSNSLRKILTLDTWNEMYEVCTAKLPI